MSKCRWPIRSQNHQKYYYRAFTALDIHKHCQLPMLRACQCQPGTCKEHSIISRKEDVGLCPALDRLPKKDLSSSVEWSREKWNPSAAGGCGPQNLSMSLKRNLKGLRKYFNPNMRRKSTLNGSATIPGASLQLHLSVIQLSTSIKTKIKQ